MIGILLVSHEPLGTALLRCTRHIYGRLPPQTAALDVVPDEDPDAAHHSALELVKRINDGSGVLVLTDAWGATPARIAGRLVDPLRIEVVSGMSLPMMCRALTYRRRPMEELVPLVAEGAREAVRVIAPADRDASCASPDKDPPCLPRK